MLRGEGEEAAVGGFGEGRHRCEEAGLGRQEEDVRGGLGLRGWGCAWEEEGSRGPVGGGAECCFVKEKVAL